MKASSLLCICGSPLVRVQPRRPGGQRKTCSNPQCLSDRTRRRRAAWMRRRRSNPTARSKARQYELWMAGKFVGWGGRIEPLPLCLRPPRNATQMIGEQITWSGAGEELPVSQSFGRSDKHRRAPLTGWAAEVYDFYSRKAA